MSNKVLLIGDIHQKYDQYFKICEQHEYTIQIGDTGFSNSILLSLNPNKHKFITGNHNDHNNDYNLPNCLGRFGNSSLNNVNFFFVSGGFSLDWKYRTKIEFKGGPKTYFENEELNRQEQQDCLDLYSKVKPDILITHEPPRVICNLMGNPKVLKSFGYNPETFNTTTSQLLDDMIQLHRPKVVVSGHMHQWFEKTIKDTDFIVLPELGCLVLDL